MKKALLIAFSSVAFASTASAEVKKEPIASAEVKKEPTVEWKSASGQTWTSANGLKWGSGVDK